MHAKYKRKKLIQIFMKDKRNTQKELEKLL